MDSVLGECRAERLSVSKAKVKGDTTANILHIRCKQKKFSVQGHFKAKVPEWAMEIEVKSHQVKIFDRRITGGPDLAKKRCLPSSFHCAFLLFSYYQDFLYGFHGLVLHGFVELLLDTSKQLPANNFHVSLVFFLD